MALHASQAADAAGRELTLCVLCRAATLPACARDLVEHAGAWATKALLKP
jgi:hypothetical protein